MNTNGKETNTESCACGPDSGHAETKVARELSGILSRRRFLRATVAGTAAGGLAGLGTGLVAPRSALALSTLTPTRPSSN